MIIECRLVDDLPPALVEEPETLRLTAFLACRPRCAIAWNRKSAATGRRAGSTCATARRWDWPSAGPSAPLTQTVRVYPALRTGEEQQIFLARSRQIDLQLRRAQLRGLGRDFESLRDYREGDDLRDICWTATARRGSLITRQYQTERSQPVWIVLDCGRLMRARVRYSRKYGL
jgi:uncharacterized protein (DUF58 family)